MSGILRQWPEFHVSGVGRDGYDAMQAGRLFQPDIALVGDDTPLLDCSEIVLALKRWSPKTKVIVLTGSCDNQLVLKAIGNGAAGYLFKNKDADIIPGIKLVYDGGSLMSPEVAARAFTMSPLFRKLSPWPEAPINLPAGREERQLFHKEQSLTDLKRALQITRKQLELLVCIGQGFSNKEIAAMLQLKNGTIRNYISILLRKTGRRNRTEMAIFAYQFGLVDDEQSGKTPAGKRRAANIPQ
jgi:DNA-binding NarL/FixJ family response regulator